MNSPRRTARSGLTSALTLVTLLTAGCAGGGGDGDDVEARKEAAADVCVDALSTVCGFARECLDSIPSLARRAIPAPYRDIVEECEPVLEGNRDLARTGCRALVDTESPVSAFLQFAPAAEVVQCAEQIECSVDTFRAIGEAVVALRDDPSDPTPVVSALLGDCAANFTPPMMGGGDAGVAGGDAGMSIADAGAPGVDAGSTGADAGAGTDAGDDRLAACLAGCPGCCDPTGTCYAGDSTFRCGATGAMCNRCDPNQVCEAGACEAEPPPAGCATSRDCMTDETCRVDGTCAFDESTRYDLYVRQLNITRSTGFDPSGEADPYVIVSLVSQPTRQTRTISNDDHPDYNEQIYTSLRAWQYYTELTITVYDEDRNADDLVGTLTRRLTQADLRRGYVDLLHTYYNIRIEFRENL